MLVSALASKLRECQREFNEKILLQALEGLEGLEDSPEAQEMLAAFAPKLQQCTHLTKEDVSKALRAIERFKSSENLQQLEAWMKAIETTGEISDDSGFRERPQED